MNKQSFSLNDLFTVHQYLSCLVLYGASGGDARFILIQTLFDTLV